MIRSLLRGLADLAWLRRRPTAREESPPFLSGLAIGALVGAAIAGSAVWRRLRNGHVTAGESAHAPEVPREAD